MKNIIISVLVLFAGFTVGRFSVKPESVHLCASFSEKYELEVKSGLTLQTQDGNILAVLSPEELPEVLKDPRLTFHSCGK